MRRPALFVSCRRSPFAGFIRQMLMSPLSPSFEVKTISPDENNEFRDNRRGLKRRTSTVFRYSDFRLQTSRDSYKNCSAWSAIFPVGGKHRRKIIVQIIGDARDFLVCDRDCPKLLKFPFICRNEKRIFIEKPENLRNLRHFR